MLNNGMTPQNALFMDDDGQVYSLINLIKDISSNSNGGNFTPQEKEKLANIEDNANNYVHPENHEPSIIIQDNEHRFVTDTEKETWDNKLSEHQDISHLAVKSEVDESLSQINQSNIERDKKISSIENINAVQNAKLDTLFNSASGEMELESNSNNIKLDSSKKGTATVNYIRGNTLVNCAKENKELILNDEINVEGTTCTINDTVEGGLVDVELEGLSLNNIHPSSQYEFGCNSVNMGRFVLNKGTDKINIVINENLESWYYCDLGKVDVNLLKPNTKYTLIFSNASGLTGVKLASGDLTYQISNLASIKNNMAVITTNDMSNLPSNPKGICVYTSIVGTAGTTVNAEKVMILEGDYTNKPIPTEAFTGIKSVGEEVTLTNLVTRYSYNSAQYVATSYVDNSKVKANDICTVVVDNPSEEDMRVYLNEDLFDKAPSFIVPSKSSIKYLATVKKDYVYSADAPRQSALLKNSITHTNAINYKACLIVGDYKNSNLEYFEGSIKKYKIETKTYIDLDTLSLTEGIENVPYTPHKHHKKVILLDEPLRGIEGKSKDITTKIENKSYEKRVCSEVVLNGNENWTKYGDLGKCLCFYYKLPNQHGGSYTFINDKLKSIHSFDDTDHIHINDTGLHITIEKTKLETQDVDGFKKWLQANPVTVVYQLATPVCEEIKGLDNEYPTYAEVTHISTNTVIPCNQKIQNTGIECMLKPSTLYSIHDIRTGSGIAKYNLGGTVNTSNKITTGATLIDNYLRLYGKGFTSKDVEVFEGDTPQTPYFSGMLSAFEDKKITQEMVDIGLEKVENLGKYKVGVKVVGKNLFDGKMELGNIDVSNGNDVSSSTVMRSSFIKVKPPFVFSRNSIQGYIGFRYYDKNKNYIGSLSFNGLSYTITNENVAYFRFTSVNGVISNDYQIEEGTVATPYEPYKEYKTSILLDKPLLKGDEICVQNGQLGVLHNSTDEIDYNNLKYNITYEGFKIYECLLPKLSTNLVTSKINIISDNFKCKSYDDRFKNMSELECYLTNNKKMFIISNKELNELKEIVKNSKFIYPLAEPYFEPITPQLPRWVLDIFDNSTISIDTIIPVESKFTYTSYIPSITAMQETNKNQDDLINVSLCATDEMYMMLEPLLQSVPQTLQNERMMSKMVDLYVAMVMRGLKTIDEVPLRYREEVKKILEQLDE